ncbi:TPA: hypothetical protein L9W05_000444 [Klebsiella pneumoniae]|nr:hypothetical protein [Klebsiella pneumoniae]
MAERILVSGSWWVTANASVIYTNPEGIVPGESGRTHLALGAAANEERNLNRPGNKWQDGIY